MPYIIIVVLLVAIAGGVGFFITRDAGTASDIVSTDANGQPLTEERQPSSPAPVPAAVPEPELAPALSPEDETIATESETDDDSDDDNEDSIATSTDTTVTPTNDESETDSTEAGGVSGVFTGEASYSTGRAIHELVVTLTLENDIVVATDMLYDGDGEPATPMLTSFNDAYETEVIGKDIDDIELSRVGGASWTSDAFNEAVAEIKASARS